MPEVISASPFRCRMWHGHDRLEEYITGASCREEMASIAKHGQMIPVLGRLTVDDAAYDYELIYGARRLFVARELKVSLLVELRPLSDRQAIVALDIENRLRRDVSPYERGRSYRSWIRTGIFPSQDEMARELNVSSSQVSRLMRLAQLPTVLVNAFGSPSEIRETWGRDLMDMWEDTKNQPSMTAVARSIGRRSRRPAATVVLQQLTSSISLRSRTELENAHDEVITSDIGQPLFKVRVRRHDVALLLPTKTVSQQTLAEIKLQVASILQRAISQPSDCKRRRFSKSVAVVRSNGLETTQPTAA